VTTDEIEKLYLAHADDFRLLLGKGDVLAEFGKCELSYSRNHQQWMLLWPSHGKGDTTWSLPSPEMSVAAFTESWRDGLEKEHGIFFTPGIPSGWRVARFQKDANPAYVIWLRTDGAWSDMGSRDFPTYPAAICAAVHALAEEERKVANPAPSPAAVRAAERIADLGFRALGGDHRQKFNAQSAAIIEEELAKANHGYRLEFDGDRVRLVCPPCDPTEQTVTGHFDPGDNYAKEPRK